MSKPNVLYLHSHDTGRYIQPYGHAIPTPHLQRFAEQGVLFRQAFCANPTCSPSRAALLTGQWAHCCGQLGLRHRGFAMPDLTRTLPAWLRRHGYRTALIGIQHIAGNADEIRAAGYDEKFEGEADAWLAGRPREPFFLDVGFFETHRHGIGFNPPLDGQTPVDPRYVRPAPTVPDTPATRADMAAFMDTARRLDTNMGAVLAALDRHGYADNTLVIITTDHGIAFPGMKCHLTDHGLGVMLMLRGPGFTGGRVVDEMVSHVDVFPTVCETLGLPKPAWLQGQSLWQPCDEIFAEVNYHAAYEPQRAVRTKRHKYIRRYNGRTRPVLPNIDDSPSKDVWLTGNPTRCAEELYDLVADPGETRNLAGNDGMLAEMRARLDRWMRTTNDPLLAGPIPLPAGARVNDPDGRSPNEPCVSPAAGNGGGQTR